MQQIIHPITKESLPIKAWCSKLNIPLSTFYYHLKQYGKNDIRIFNNTKRRGPRARRKFITNPFTNETLSVKEWADRLNITPAGFTSRVKALGINNPATFKPKNKTNINEVLLHNPHTNESLTLEQWSSKLNISVQTMCARLRHLDTSDPNLFKPKLIKTYSHPLTGETLSQSEWARKLGISRQAFHVRLQYLNLSDPKLFLPKQV